MQQSVDRWQDYWAITPRYERWIESLEVPIHRAYYVQDLRTIEVGPWEERECNAAVVVLEGNKDFMETRVTEIPPAAALPPFKFSLDDIVYVLSGHGLTTVWAYEGGPKHTFEWEPHSLFFIPRNYSYQLSNAQGHEPARLLHYNYLPIAMSITPEPSYFFNNPALEPSIDIMGGEEHNVYSEAKWVQNARRRMSGGWVASFFPDLMAFDKLHGNDTMAPLPNLSYCLPNITSLRIGGRVLPSGTYKPAHYHGAGAIIVIPGGEGFSLMWPVFDESQEKAVHPMARGQPHRAAQPLVPPTHERRTAADALHHAAPRPAHRTRVRGQRHQVLQRGPVGAPDVRGRARQARREEPDAAAALHRPRLQVGGPWRRLASAPTERAPGITPASPRQGAPYDAAGSPG